MDDISAWPALGDPAPGGLPPLSPGLKATATTNSVSSGSDDPNNPGWEMIEEEEEEEEEGDAAANALSSATTQSSDLVVDRRVFIFPTEDEDGSP